MFIKVYGLHLLTGVVKLVTECTLVRGDDEHDKYTIND